MRGSNLLSGLPDNVIDIILSCLPLLDAVKTSILSKEWRHHWTRIETLVLDENFFDKVLYQIKHPNEYYDANDSNLVDYDEEDDDKDDDNKKFTAYKYESIVGQVLLSHVGSICKFVLYIPDFGNSLTPGIINLWIRFASQCGVQNLRIEYENPIGHKCPSSLFQCSDLKLLSLECHMMSGDTVSNIFSKCPQLESVYLDFPCAEYNDSTFVISTPKLGGLYITFFNFIDFIFKNTPNLSYLYLTTAINEEREKHMNKFQDIVDFFGAIPKVESIKVSGVVLAQWPKQDIPYRLPVRLEDHESFTIYGLNMYSPRQLRCALCLIESSPYLDGLHISVDQCEPVHNSDETVDYLQSQVTITEDKESWSLGIVKFHGITGKKPELLLIKLILSCCPMLETLHFSSSPTLSSDAEIKMLTEITRFRRASPQAELIYLGRKIVNIFF